ncbi:MAG: hypothetical protein Q8M16_03075 [Pirellulaceae bacterium]|nr:hypothetical protein [Pirellulaceae bacterium]
MRSGQQSPHAGAHPTGAAHPESQELEPPLPANADVIGIGFGAVVVGDETGLIIGAFWFLASRDWMGAVCAMAEADMNKSPNGRRLTRTIALVLLGRRCSPQILPINESIKMRHCLLGVNVGEPLPDEFCSSNWHCLNKNVGTKRQI